MDSGQISARDVRVERTIGGSASLQQVQLRRVEPYGDQAGIRPAEAPAIGPSSGAAQLAHRVLTSTVPTLVCLSVLALGIEVAQSWPELFKGAHALSEFLRNLAYALIGALIFHWILVQVPQERRQRATYIAGEQALQLLVQTPASLVEMHRLAARTLQLPDAEIDAWDRLSLRRCLRSLDRTHPPYLKGSVQILSVALDALQLALDTLEKSVPFMHEDVAQALAVYPAKTGLHQLQPPTADMKDAWNRWEHITWELLKASRSLQAALRQNAPYLDLKIEAGEVSLGSGQTSHPRLSDLERSST